MKRLLSPSSLAFVPLAALAIFILVSPWNSAAAQGEPPEVAELEGAESSE